MRTSLSYNLSLYRGHPSLRFSLFSLRFPFVFHSFSLRAGNGQVSGRYRGNSVMRPLLSLTKWLHQQNICYRILQFPLVLSIYIKIFLKNWPDFLFRPRFLCCATWKCNKLGKIAQFFAFFWKKIWRNQFKGLPLQCKTKKVLQFTTIYQVCKTIYAQMCIL